MENKNEKRLVKGRKGLADYIGCHISTVTNWANAGKLNDCRIKIGKTVIFDLDKFDAKFGRK